jgi:hypothetical protein
VRTKEFLTMVLPDEGYLIVSAPASTGKGWWNNVVDDIPEMQAQSAIWLGDGKDVYFAMASYAEKRVWSPTKIDYRTKKPGAYEKRTQANVKFIRSLFLDLDIDAKDEKKYPDQRTAFGVLRDFCRAIGLPKPIIVNSGYGIHTYWPFTEQVTREVWEPVAEKLKSACIAYGLKQDSKVTTDAARVLRIPGTTNFKRGGAAKVEVVGDAAPHPLADLDAILTQYVVAKGVPVATPRVLTGLPARSALPDGVEGNIGATNDPLNGNSVVFSCAAMTKLVANRGATATEPQWRAGLGIARYCTAPKVVMLAISDGYPGFTEQAMNEKVANMTAGPTKCTTFWGEDQPTCEGCPHWQKITSPASLGRPFRETPPEVKANEPKIPSPPYPYMRKKHDKLNETWVYLRDESKEEDEASVDHLVLPYDLYPKRIMEQTSEDDGESDERSMWVAVLPRKGEVEFKMPQSMLSDPRKLHGFLLSRGVHINPKHAKATQYYMSAYLNELAKAVDRERAFERLGWHDDHKLFVMPNAIYHRDGTSTNHVPSKVLEAVTKNAMHTKGTLQGWKDAMMFYAGPQYPATRTCTYITWGAPLLHMTNLKGVLVAASGDTGRGKTTTLEACASIFGKPDDMLVAGGAQGSTINAMFSNLGTNHSMPMFWDDTTERDPDEMREFMLHISTGKGKERMKGNTHDGRVVTWETIVISSANTDDVHRIMSTGKDSDPHLMRFISIPFDSLDRSTEAKILADEFKRGIRANYGHGWVYLQYITKNYEAVRTVVLKEMERFDRLLQAQSEERHWSATLAVAYVGGRIAYMLGLSPFNPRDDEDWMVNHIDRMRISYKEAKSTPADIISEFLDNNVSHTLILSPKLASSVDNIVNRPQGKLYIRNEVDTNKIYIAVEALNNYCTEKKVNIRMLEAELRVAKILLRRNCYKVLGADTPFSSGQARCWEIDRTVLSTIKKGGRV